MNQKDQKPAPAPIALEREVSFDPQMLAVISKAEIDMQIATAHRFPRVVSTFLGEAEQLVTLNEYVADECIYSLPARGEGGEAIEGPSARFAEVILHAWGNSRAGARVVGEDGGFIVCQGAFHDLQKNTAISYEVRRKITNRRGVRYSDDMIGMTGNAGCAIALRNAILKGVPKAFWIAPYEAARKVLVGDYKTLESRRAETLERFTKFGIRPERIYEKFGIKGLEDLTLELVFQLRTMLNAVRDGDTTIDEQFPKAPTSTDRSATAGLAAAVGGAGSTAAAAAAEVKDSAKGPTVTGTITGAAVEKSPGTVEARDAIIARIKATKSVDSAADAVDTANLYDFTKVDRGMIDNAYNQHLLELG